MDYELIVVNPVTGARTTFHFALTSEGYAASGVAAERFAALGCEVIFLDPIGGEEEPPTCSICDGYHGGFCPLEDSGRYDDEPSWAI